MKGKLANGVGSRSDAVYVDLVVTILCVTVCHHVSTGLYHSLSAQRLSERTVHRRLVGVHRSDPA